MWRSETNSFHFRVGKATITLQDVQVIWGLPIDGEPVSGTDLERTSVQWQEYCMQYIGFAPEEGALKGSWLQVKAIISHISRVHITPDTPHLTIVQYARVVTLLLLSGTMCLDSSGNLRKRQSCNRWRVAVGTDQLDTRDMSLHKITRSNRTGTDWVLQHILYITRWQRRYDTVIQRQLISNRRDTDRGYWEWYNNITRHFVSSSTDRRVESDTNLEMHQCCRLCAPTTSHRQKRSSSQMSIGSVERGDIGVDIAGPSTAYTPQDYYVPQPPQDYYVPQPSHMIGFNRLHTCQAMQKLILHM
ncbi:UNVERIFIED_CONTAM: Serine/threonine-protein phosphatase 7 long form [Sesamum angustifolium]|uniref:Serine/threonine-protein phosphatase 7 long form n=1 Tax=Sesamum angustifolium TaxID=2727405 RepID=A0AAW2MAS5_9LAMI